MPAIQLLEPIKAKYPGLTFADLYTFAGKVALEAMGSPDIKWSPGRTDAADEVCHTP
jgi:catalase (peroxidase I)